jgi:NitT/TauT family transport system ATP-binding protein
MGDAGAEMGTDHPLPENAVELNGAERSGDTDEVVEEIGVGHVLDHVRKPEESKAPHVVEFKQVTKTFNVGGANEFTAIRDVTFVVEDIADIGEFVAILGPSGCGKSTILRLIAGLEPQHPATDGEVLVQGQPVLGPGSDRGMVFQDYTSFDHRTVLDNVTFGLECHGVPRAIRRDLGYEWIERVGLSVEHDANKYPHELSGGMRQRVAIARSLILKPRIILMDEPFGALDPETRMDMQDLLVSLWRAVEATVFFVTHSIEEAVYLGDRVYILSASPGTLVREIVVDPPDRPAKEMQRESKFQDTVYYIRDLITSLEEKKL